MSFLCVTYIVPLLLQLFVDYQLIRSRFNIANFKSCILSPLKVGPKCCPRKSSASCLERLGNGTASFRRASFIPRGCRSIETDQAGASRRCYWCSYRWPCQSTTYDLYVGPILRFLHELGGRPSGTYTIFPRIGRCRWPG